MNYLFLLGLVAKIGNIIFVTVKVYSFATNEKIIARAKGHYSKSKTWYKEFRSRRAAKKASRV